ncbi:hypothetical protein [Methylomonas paludis]|nr:hypothetical protein [Methylomonas paludis]
MVDEAEMGISELGAEFINRRDCFYQATVSESGWSYVQHHGGPQVL